MFEYLQDKYILLPIVKRTDFLFTTLKLTPNAITLVNGFLVSNLIFYFWGMGHFLLGLFAMMLRNLLDASDGYIARKYKLSTPHGEMLDHVSDCIFQTLTAVLFLWKLGFSQIVTLIFGQIVALTLMLCLFHPELQHVSHILAGAGGGYDAYVTVSYIIVHCVISWL
jgi:phosphatidylglycerophosphate synthase